MARIAVVKVRTPHDLEWRAPGSIEVLRRIPLLGKAFTRLSLTSGQAFMPQLVLPYLSALGHRYNQDHNQDHSFTLFDEKEENLKLEKFDMVWFTCNTPAAPATYRVSDRLRARGIPTVIGGIHPSTLPEEALEHADTVVIGEGEDAVPLLLEDLDSGRGLQRIYRGGLAKNLENLPVPRWEDAAVADYCPWVIPVQTSRGCRNACSFCSTTRFQGAARRHRPVEDIVNELKTLQDKGILTRDKTVFFTDNNIVSDTDHRRGLRDTAYARSLFKALKPLNITWVGQGEIGVGEDPELVSLMAASGCHMLLVGLETVVQDNLGRVGKSSNLVDSYVSSIRTLHNHGIALIGCFIWGFDQDTPGIFEETLRFIEEHIEVPQLSLMTPFPGTSLFRKLEKEKRILHHDWSRFDITHGVIKPGSMGEEELEARYQAAGRRLFSTTAILRRTLRYALRPTIPGTTALGPVARATSVLFPNFIYRGLSLVGRTSGASQGLVEPSGSPDVPLKKAS